MEKRHIAILGSTGSIGTQTLEVISAYPEKFEVEVLTANNNADLLIQEAKSHKPNCVVLVNEELYDRVRLFEHGHPADQPHQFLSSLSLVG